MWGNMLDLNYSCHGSIQCLPDQELRQCQGQQEQGPVEFRVELSLEAIEEVQDTQRSFLGPFHGAHHHQGSEGR